MAYQPIAVHEPSHVGGISVRHLSERPSPSPFRSLLPTLQRRLISRMQLSSAAQALHGGRRAGGRAMPRKAEGPHPAPPERPRWWRRAVTEPTTSWAAWC